MVQIFAGITRLQDKFYKFLSGFISRFVIGQKLLAYIPKASDLQNIEFY